MASTSRFLGRVAFIGGLGIALLMSFGSLFNENINQNPYLALILVIFGVLIGIFNIRGKEDRGFLIAAFALAGVNSLVVWNGYNVLGLFNVLVENLGTILVRFVSNITILVVPAAIIVGLKVVWLFAIEK